MRCHDQLMHQYIKGICLLDSMGVRVTKTLEQL